MNTDFLPQIDADKCIGCELCVRLCPNGALALVNELAVVAVPQACTYNGICQEICPTEAVSLTYEIVFPNEKGADSGSPAKVVVKIIQFQRN
jgi:formate hydrogenlyase subunit 6/NADH:ubiquinone oxidoreductase subunit I